MDIKEFQNKAWEIIDKYNKKHNMEHKKDIMFLHLIEEVGELARQMYNEKDNWRKDFDKEKFEEELIDVLFFLLIIAKDYDVNIEKVFNRKFNKLKQRYNI